MFQENFEDLKNGQKEVQDSQGPVITIRLSIGIFWSTLHWFWHFLTGLMYGHFVVYIILIMILVKSNINKLLIIIIIIIIIIIKEFSLSSTSPETEMINLRYALK